ncbi:hypothetical protein GCM10011487_64110 [Steroidobacter agaridevorans]|uniref:Uncharacterized protein n=1 Tax=Steroidobacter agaridevorans TaxID=2695856 RepID=A0A829YNB4_9GAMM|nr:hypothetical protein [Steroidobacter agaridevorans]GFE84411.1 hypothetical protein GCM10011487_64110 [Steroidobacter agaridevorans]
MDYEPILAACDDPAIGAALTGAIGQLFENQIAYLKRDVKEETIAARLAQYLAPHFDGFDIDVEYNKMGDIPKQVAWNEKPELVYPDLIVHIAGTETNILVMELKKDSNPKSKDGDIRKLRAYRRELGYLHALFIRFGVRERAGTISECEWVDV